MHGETLLAYLCGDLNVKWRNSWLCAGEPEFDSLWRQEFFIFVVMLHIDCGAHPKFCTVDFWSAYSRVNAKMSYYILR